MMTEIMVVMRDNSDKAENQVRLEHNCFTVAGAWVVMEVVRLHQEIPPNHRSQGHTNTCRPKQVNIGRQ